MLLGALAFAATPAAAQSFDAPTPWSGPYLGIFGVAGSSDARGVSRRGDGSFGANANDESADDSYRGTGAGLLLGYQHRFSSGILVGVETDWSGTRHEGRENTQVSAANAWNGMAQASIDRESRWLSTARLRLGYASGPFMLNITGGLAMASLVETRTQYEGVSGPTQTVARFSEVDRAHPIGWTWGVGGAWRMSAAWSLRLDYLRAQFDEVSFAFPNARGGVVSGSGFASVQGRAVTNDVHMELVRIGVTYAFGAGR
jgi:opacity protein-like surface antigen